MNPINYEYEIIKHEIELGCPESKICEECIQHPELEKRLMEEANYHTHGQERTFYHMDSIVHHNPVRDNPLSKYPEDPKMYNNWTFMLP